MLPNRRLFLGTAAVSMASFVQSRSQRGVAMAAGMPQSSAAAQPAGRKFTMDLRCGAVGISADQNAAIALAQEFGFESVGVEAAFLASLSESQRHELPTMLQEKRLVWGAAGLPVEFRKDEDTFRRDVLQLPRLAQALQQAGVTRVGTWISPMHDELTYGANFRQHARRLGECVRILADHGQRFGMEYVGPKTLWASKRHSFIHTMAETKDLIAEIGMSNVGFVLDSWHWYTAHETVEDLLTLKNSDVVACDLNDAPQGIDVDQQIDSQRELPSATGVIDLAAFLGALVRMGYDGPVRAEPFNAPLNALNDRDAATATAAAMQKAFSLVPPRA